MTDKINYDFLAVYYCRCRILNREENEEQREWLKRCMCMFHWMQTDYYKAKLCTCETTPSNFCPVHFNTPARPLK